MFFKYLQRTRKKVFLLAEQENFISEAKALLNARVWIGCSLSLLQEDRKKKPAGKLKKFLLKRAFIHLVDQQKSRHVKE